MIQKCHSECLVLDRGWTACDTHPNGRITWSLQHQHLALMQIRCNAAPAQHSQRFLLFLLFIIPKPPHFLPSIYPLLICALQLPLRGAGEHIWVSAVRVFAYGLAQREAGSLFHCCLDVQWPCYGPVDISNRCGETLVFWDCVFHFFSSNFATQKNSCKSYGNISQTYCKWFGSYKVYIVFH